MKQDERIAEFRRLHESGCFVLPNPWDRGSARLLASLGFRALATSSAALAFTRGCPDAPSTVGVVATLENVRAVVGATDLPVSADFQAGYGDSPGAVGENVLRCIEAGVAGLSIEDASGEADEPLYELERAVERVQAARSAIRLSGRDVVLTARAECFLVGHPKPLETAIERLIAYAEAGADCLFAPGLETPDEVRAVVAALDPKPVNVLARDPGWMSVSALADLGVRRISVGSALFRAGWAGFRAAAEEMAASGSLSGLAQAEPFSKLNELFL